MPGTEARSMANKRKADRVIRPLRDRPFAPGSEYSAWQAAVGLGVDEDDLMEWVEGEIVVGRRIGGRLYLRGSALNRLADELDHGAER
jgi:hypothetical protein